MELVVRFIRSINLKAAIFFGLLSIILFFTVDDYTAPVVSLVLCIYSSVMHVLTNIFFNMIKKIINNS